MRPIAKTIQTANETITISEMLNELLKNESYKKAVRNSYKAYKANNWGDIGTDEAWNEEALKEGSGYIVGRYDIKGKSIIMETDLDAKRTAMMLIEEY